MKGVKIDFSQDFSGTSDNLATFNFNEVVEDHFAAAQNCLVNTATIVGTDKIYDDRGTDLLKAGIIGRITDIDDSTHEANFAATETLFFNNLNAIGDMELIRSYKLEPLDIVNNSLQLNAFFTFADETTLGIEILTDT